MATNYSGIADADDELIAIRPNLSLPQKRSGAWLKEKYFAVSAPFTRAYHNWARFGQNNPEVCNFIDIVPRAPLSTDVSSLGRYCLIMFHDLKCSTANEDTETLNFTSKIVPSGAGYDDAESKEMNTSQGGQSRKRKRIYENIIRGRVNRTKGTAKLASTVEKLVSSKPNDSSHQPNDDGNMKGIIDEIHISTKKFSE